MPPLRSQSHSPRGRGGGGGLWSPALFKIKRPSRRADENPQHRGMAHIPAARGDGVVQQTQQPSTAKGLVTNIGAAPSRREIAMKVDHVSKHYKTQTGSVHALEDLT